VEAEVPRGIFIRCGEKADGRGRGWVSAWERVEKSWGVTTGVGGVGGRGARRLVAEQALVLKKGCPEEMGGDAGEGRRGMIGTGGGALNVPRWVKEPNV